MKPGYEQAHRELVQRQRAELRLLIAEIGAEIAEEERRQDLARWADDGGAG